MNFVFLYGYSIGVCVFVCVSPHHIVFVLCAYVSMCMICEGLGTCDVCGCAIKLNGSNFHSRQRWRQEPTAITNSSEIHHKVSEGESGQSSLTHTGQSKVNLVWCFVVCFLCTFKWWSLLPYRTMVWSFHLLHSSNCQSLFSFFNLGSALRLVRL